MSFLFCVGATDFRSTQSPRRDRGDGRSGGRGGLEPGGAAGLGEEDEKDPEKGGEEEA